jgi:hypothetical protein
MKRSPFDFDISVSADKKRRAKGRNSSRGMSGAFDTSSRKCDHEGCEQSGKYRAPKNSDHLNEYWWFCMDHVRAYNLKWNFFENHSDEELEKQFAADKVWERPTRPLRDSVENQHPNSEEAAWARFGINDPTEVLGGNATQNPDHRGKERMRRLPPVERKAIAILDAKENWTKTEIRKQYKALVKDLHPDMNGGKRDDEERLQEVVWAWDQIKTSRIFKD